MECLLLGTGAYPLRCTNPLSTCLFLPAHGVCIDAGLGFSQLPETYTTETLSIFLTHYHHDHILGLAFLANVLENGQCKKVRIIGDERVPSLMAFFTEPFNPTYTSAQFPVSMEAMKDSLEFNGLAIYRKSFPHASGFSNSYKWTDGTSTMAIMTDTTPTKAHAEFIKNVDILFVECNFDNASKERAIVEGHAYPDAIIECCDIAKPNRVIVIHSDPRYPNKISELQKIPSLLFGKDGLTITS